MVVNGWFYLLAASCMEIFWMISLKYLNFKAIKAIDWTDFFISSAGFYTVLPLISYILFGLGNVVLFSFATKSLELGTAFAVWLGLALVGTILIDIFYFKVHYSVHHLFFLLLILVGVIGLKVYK